MSKEIKVLITSYEADPFYKRGGLGDVIGSLPQALLETGVDARIVIPYYEAIKEKFNAQRIGGFTINFGEKQEQVGIYKINFPDSETIAYFLSNKPNLSYINTRGRNKKIEQFAFFDLAVAHFIGWLPRNQRWTPSLLHCNDWQTALTPVILQNKYHIHIPTLLTIHNLGYQGWGSVKVLDLLHINDEDLKELKRGVPVTEINALGEGILHADCVSTVSKSYAEEILNNGGRELIYKFIRRRVEENGRKCIIGIINGIDYKIWNPEQDSLIFHKYSSADWDIGKKINKEDLLRSVGLSDKPTICFVGRLATQKGLDVLVRAIGRLMELNLNIIILGSGDPNIEKSIERIVEKYPKNIVGNFVYNEELAHKLYAGSDFIIVPSHYEPCGLIQMVGMHYGTLPIASKTGGLRDSIKNNLDGFLFKKDSSRALVKTVKRALRAYNDQDRYRKMVERAMNTDFTWAKSARQYKHLYRKILKPHS